MANAPNARVTLSIHAAEVLTGGIKAGQIPHRFESLLNLNNGTSDGSIDLVWSERKTGVAASATTVYDLAGVLTDSEGSTITFAEVVLIAIRNLSTDAVDHLEVGPDATAGFGVLASNRGFWADASDRSIVMPTIGANEGWIVMHAPGGVPVGAGSTDELAVITPSGSAANTWDILIIGRSA